MLEQTFAQIFERLRQAGYSWEPLTPEMASRSLREGANPDPLTRIFGLGDRSLLPSLGFPAPLAARIEELAPLVCRFDDLFVAHTHWTENSSPVYLGLESFRFARSILGEDRSACLRGKRVLDLGSGAGFLALVASTIAEKAVGIDNSARAVEWATATARAQSLSNVRFLCAEIGRPDAGAELAPGVWDTALSNPPFAIPSPGTHRPQRDGGRLGIELPLAFVDFALSKLREGGDLLFMATNPIVGGRDAFFEALREKDLKIVEKTRMHTDFNRGLFRKDGYDKLGIERVELWLIHAVKESGAGSPFRSRKKLAT